MPHILQLQPHVADLIAAGEVVERPASVVKELVENAVDAGAGAIVVEIQRGGMGLIRVTDDGCGIAPSELPTAFLRHATSKMRTAEDLGAIATLGFRGEALAAIAAVSRVDIVSCQEGGTGARLALEGGKAGAVEPWGAPRGTTIRVQDLFYNTPARLKFMKKDSAETAAVAGLMQHLALSHPQISFKFIKDGVAALHTPGDGELLSAIYAAQGRDFAKSLIPVSGRGGEVAVEGFVTQPLFGRGSRAMQTFFVNGRFIKSQLLTAALEEGYRNQMMKGKFPGCVLHVTLPVTGVDVNVHPAKTTVKFAREKEVFDAVYHTVLDCLNARGSSAGIPGTPRAPGEAFRTMDAAAFRRETAAAPSAPRAGGRAPAWDTELRRQTQVRDASPLVRPAPAPSSAATATLQGAAGRSALDVPPPRETAPSRGEDQTAPRPFPPAIPREEVPGQQALPETEGEAPWRIAGEILRTYIVCESGEGDVYLIDKHAAHERMNFDRLQARQAPPMRQTLLTPIPVELGREETEALLENLPLLEELGFACEDFGDGTLLVREVPGDVQSGDVPSILEEMAQGLRTSRSPEQRREQLLHTMACKAAIKGGWHTDERELRAIVEQVQSGRVRYCPHGRPVAVKLTKYQLEKLFKRA